MWNIWPARRGRGFISAAIFIVLLTQAIPLCLAQNDGEVPLGDVARSYRKDKDKDKAEKPPQLTVIDNENLGQVMDEIQSRKFSSRLLFSFDSVGKDLEVSSPDVTCSLSFDGKAAALLSDPYVPRDLPAEELAKLDGPAVIEGDTLQVSIYNGSEWNIKELTVGLTLVRRSPRPYGPPQLKPAAERTVETDEKRSDQTVLYHLKGAAAPQATTVFAENLTEEPGPDQEWHWAIVSAKGVPPKQTTLPEFPGAPITPAESSSAPPSP